MPPQTQQRFLHRKMTFMPGHIICTNSSLCAFFTNPSAAQVGSLQFKAIFRTHIINLQVQLLSRHTFWTVAVDHTLPIHTRAEYEIWGGMVVFLSCCRDAGLNICWKHLYSLLFDKCHQPFCRALECKRMFGQHDMLWSREMCH